jgi:N-acyl-phosphatidylethanolamine-hydrolysing phospholipase D
VTRPADRGGPRPRPSGGASSLTGATPPHHLPGRGFRNPWPDLPPQRLRDLLRWNLDRLVHGVPPDPDPAVFAVVEPRLPASLAVRDLAITWIGHAAALVQMAGRNVLTDPMFGDRASPLRSVGPQRWVRPGLPLGKLPPVHSVLLSHNHYDHLDAASVRALGRRFPDAAWHVPLGLAATVRELGVASVRELDWWEAADDGPLRIVAAPAQHFSARTPFDRNRTLWCSWAIAGAGRRVFFAGDTGYHPAFGEIGRRLGPFDAALLPVGAYAPRWFMRAVHMDPEEAVRAFADLGDGGAGGGVLVPIHWGTFKLTDEPMDEPPRRTREAWARSGRPTDRLWLLRHGETRVLRA